MSELTVESCGGLLSTLLAVVAATRITGLDVKRGNTASELGDGEGGG